MIFGVALPVLLMAGYVVTALILPKPLSQLTWAFVTSASSLTQPGGGVGPQLFCTLYLMFLSLVLTVPSEFRAVTVKLCATPAVVDEGKPARERHSSALMPAGSAATTG